MGRLKGSWYEKTASALTPSIVDTALRNIDYRISLPPDNPPRCLTSAAASALMVAKVLPRMATKTVSRRVFDSRA